LLAGFSATEAEELRRSMGFTKHPSRLRKVMVKLTRNMRERGHSDAIIDKVEDAANTFGLYGFPEAHAASFGLLAYASTWLKAHRLPEFLAGLLNNQPMGFYGPATLVQDARRHGLKFRPVCVMSSEWRCTVEADDAVRIGFNYVRGFRESAAQGLLAARAEKPFSSMNDFLARTHLTAAERRALASVGALNKLAPHRRAALWQVEAAWASDEELFHNGNVDPVVEAGAADEATPSPLAPMTLVERYQADFRGVELTTGIHPMAILRERLPDVWRASDLPLARGGERVKIAGSVICRQRPGTARGFVFISLEDETGVANSIVTPPMFESNRLVITQSHALIIIGRLQNQGGVIHIKAEKFIPLEEAAVPAQASHDFH
jgi:error-prone DNA polymerase